LSKKIISSGGYFKVLAGNHEQETWIKIHDGETYGLSKKELDTLCKQIESLDLFYIDGPIMFIHGYPTLEFLQVLLHYKNVTGNHPNSFNRDHYKKAFKSIEAINQYSYTKGQINENYLLYDPDNIELYYRKNGIDIASVLTQLEIDCIIHGHKPQASGIQIDYEFSKLLPNIRMVGNDTKVRLQEIGATIMRMDLGREMQVAFINKKTTNKKNLKKIRHLLRLSAPVSTRLQKLEIESHQWIESKSKIEELSLEYKKYQLHAERKLQKKRESLLFLKEELHEQNELFSQAKKNVISLQSRCQQLENKLLEKDHSKQVKKDKIEVLNLQLLNTHQQSEKNDSLKQELESIKVSQLKLQQELQQSNKTRKEAIEYLRLSHEARQNMEQEINHYKEDILKLHKEEQQRIFLNNEHELKRHSKPPRWVHNMYAAIISSLLTILLIYLFV